MQQSIKKVVVAALIIGVFVLYSLMHARTPGSFASANPATGSSGSNNTTSSTSSNSSSASSGSSGSGAYKDGSYTGSVADAQWGYIQVKAVVSGGKITDVQFLQYPNERSRSVEINSYADPQLTQEAIQAQSAQVDIVTGATDSSIAFMQSLGDALTQAQG
ncbi:MAG TPA: FMN-binding protein [Ktedonobacterales bacterium]|nr:FMN-binding protein [Ktedonobacterales bacterium]